VTAPERLTQAAARRIALAAQGFAEQRPARANAGHFDRMLRRLQVLQIDSVNVLARSHYLPGFARLGAYAPSILEQAAWSQGKRRRLFEYWGHEASLLPLELHPWFRWRMADAAAGKGIYSGLAKFGRDNRAFCDAVLREIEQRGAMGAGELEDGGKGAGGWWGWSRGKMAVEWLFWAGLITTRTRRGFERIYDLPERALPAAVLARPTPPKDEAIRHLLALSACAMGIGTAAELRDYFRLPVEGFRVHLAALVEEGLLLPAEVQGLRPQHFVHRDARRPRKVEAQALLSPFDNLVWERDRTERLFDFFYRLEIYTPGPKRKHGYYVLPFLLGEALPARVCLKADRAAGVLKVNTAHLQPGHDAGAVAAPLAEELGRMAGWLGLERVSVGRKGDLALELARAVKRAS
jgi:uncharacterized protein YcaQ